MLRTAFALAAILAVSVPRPAAAEFPISALTEGNPRWFIAARCLGALLVQPEVERNGQPERLAQIIASDPALQVVGRGHPGSDVMPPTLAGRVVGRVEWGIYTGARDITAGLFRRNEYNAVCEAFTYGPR